MDAFNSLVGRLSSPQRMGHRGPGDASPGTQHAAIPKASAPPLSITANLAEHAPLYTDVPSPAPSVVHEPLAHGALPVPAQPERPLPPKPSPEAMATSISRMNLLEKAVNRHEARRNLNLKGLRTFGRREQRDDGTY